jgi:hypothetical protein
MSSDPVSGLLDYDCDLYTLADIIVFAFDLYMQEGEPELLVKGKKVVPIEGEAPAEGQEEEENDDEEDDDDYDEEDDEEGDGGEYSLKSS